MQERCRDYLVRFKPGQFFTHSTAAVLHGLPLIEEAIHWARAGALSPAETRVRLLLERAGVPAPELNGAIFFRLWQVLGQGRSGVAA